MFQARNGLVNTRNGMFFAGWSYGDAKIYKYRMGDRNGFYCLNPKTDRADDLAAIVTLTSGEEAMEQGRYTKQDELVSSTLLTGQEDSGLIVWMSKYAGGFALGSRIHFPRECNQNGGGGPVGSIDYPIGSLNIIKEVSYNNNNKYTYVKWFDQIGDIARIDQDPGTQF